MNFEADIVYVVVEAIAKAKKSVTQTDLLDEVPFDSRKVTGVLFALFACGFLTRDEQKKVTPAAETDYAYCITKNISAYQIIKLGEIGLDMNSLSELVKISDKQKQAAMALTMQTDKLMEMDAQARATRAEAASKSSPPKELPRDSIVDTLERLALASELSINEMKGAKGSEELVKALMEAKEQAMKALHQYQKQLQAGGADNVGF